MGRLTTFICCRNHGHYLREAALSCLKQTAGPDQLILLNDGSNDRTHYVMQDLADNNPNVSMITHEIPQGNIASYNECIQVSRGTFIHLMAADDYLKDRTFYERALVMLQDPEVSFVAGGLSHLVQKYGNWTDGEIDVLPHHEGVVPSGKVLEALARRGNFINGGGVLVRRSEQMKAGPYSSDLPYSADFLNWIKILENSKKAGFIKEAVYAYRRHGGQMTARASAPERERELCMEALRRALGYKKHPWEKTTQEEVSDQP